jgi:SAM-dependent methyltransferase
MSENDRKTGGSLPFEIQPPARDAAEVRERHEANRIAWNEGAAAYAEEVEETIRFLRGGGSNLHPGERANLGDLRPWCRKAIHLQCASGRDTLSLLNEGVAEVVGIDISDLHIENARRTAAALGWNAIFLRCDVLDAPHELDGSADLVYTGRGAFCWIHDLDAWAAVAFRLLRSGGLFSFYDDHPITWLFDFDAEDYVPCGINYFTHVETSRGWPSVYLGDLGKPIEEHAIKYERLWTVGDLFGSLRRAGFDVDRLGEHPERYWDAFPNLRPELRGRIPMTLSIVARRPTANGRGGGGGS